MSVNENMLYQEKINEADPMNGERFKQRQILNPKHLDDKIDPELPLD